MKMMIRKKLENCRFISSGGHNERLTIQTEKNQRLILLCKNAITIRILTL